MAYFRESPVPLNEADDLLDFFFDFANTYTEESVLKWYSKEKEKGREEVKDEIFESLGYSDKDILEMKN